MREVSVYYEGKDLFAEGDGPRILDCGKADNNSGSA